MGKRDPRVDQYIEKSKDFAKPILIHFRELVHKNCPQAEETIKWGFPNFEYKGPFCSMAAFKEHCAIGFWKASLMKDGDKLKENQGSAMGHLGKIETLKDLPTDKVISAYLKEAIKLNEEGKKLPPRKPTEKKELPVPKDLSAALNKNKEAKITFEKFSPSHKKEYIDWINDAKTDVTKQKRLATTIDQLKEGKTRMWKYQSK